MHVASVCLCDGAGIVLCFQVFGLAQFTGERLTAVTVLLALFGLASLPLTYFLHFFFTVSPPSSSSRLLVPWYLIVRDRDCRLSDSFWSQCFRKLTCLTLQ